MGRTVVGRTVGTGEKVGCAFECEVPLLPLLSRLTEDLTWKVSSEIKSKRPYIVVEENMVEAVVGRILGALVNPTLKLGATVVLESFFVGEMEIAGFVVDTLDAGFFDGAAGEIITSTPSWLPSSSVSIYDDELLGK